MKKLLVVVDYQVDFVNGSLGFEQAKALDSIIVDKIKTYRQNNDDVVFTLDTHGEDYLSTVEGQKLPIAHCIKNTDGHLLYGETAGMVKDSLVFEKDTFGSDKLFDFLRNSNYESVELCGLVLGICVLSNAVLAKTALPQAEIYVDTTAAIGNDPVFDRKVLDVLGGIQVNILEDKK
ncbi:MAG: cysteine hydrolase family protein [Oscillospiraceae bacterium]|nr:cysteine hydrolase family protein [Oscillospiraceae bacterium]